MRIPSGATDRYVTFTAIDSVTEAAATGLTGFTIKRSRNGGALTTYTTPTITELGDGEYALLLDEDTTITSGRDVELMRLVISHPTMITARLTVELYRPETTEGYTLHIGGSANAAGLRGDVQVGSIVASTITGDIVGDLSGSVGSVVGKVTPIDIDGLTFATALKSLLALVGGVAVPSGNQVQFKARDGSTTVVTITYGSAKGERTASTVTP